MISFIAKHKLEMVVGAIGGYSYYHFIGCVSGSCPITSQPLNSTAYGAIMGALLLTSFKKEKIKNDGK